MLDSILSSVADTVSLSFAEIAVCMVASLVLGLIIALVYMYKSEYSKNFVMTIALLPVLIQTVILLVNGNLGAGVAVMGAFSLVRFRSVPGSSREIAVIFFAMAVGLATGMGYVLYAALFTAVVSLMMLLYSRLRFGEKSADDKRLRVTVPENVDYTRAFDDLFGEYAAKYSLDKVRMTNLGSLFELSYSITLKDSMKEKEFIDKLRQRNGNLNIIVTSKAMEAREEL